LQATTQPSPRRSRFWLYTPYLLLAFLAVAWSIGWLVIRGRVEGGLDAWLAQEAQAGRNWTCPERSVAGFPFRIEVSCASLAFNRADAQATLGRLLVVAQVYNPGHVIAEVAGPLQVKAGSSSIEGRWDALRTSVHSGNGRPQRGDLVAEGTTITVTAPDMEPVTVTSNRLEAHLRPNPTEDTTADFALQLTGAAIPGLDGLIGGTEPADIDLVASITRARDLPPRPIVADMERWRAAGGRISIARLALAKGARRVQGTGTLALDDAHRPEGTFNVASAGIEGLLGRFVGGKNTGAAALIGALLGAPPVQPRVPEGVPGAAGPTLTPLPPVRLANGRVLLGPLQIPGLRIAPLY
jgi:hypothetical protein